MKTVLSIFAVAMGFLVGLVVAGQATLPAQIKASPLSWIRGSQAVAAGQLTQLNDYWNETDLNTDLLNSYINDIVCHSSEKYFLACVNSLISAASKKQIKLTTSGKLQSFTALDRSAFEASTEKANLSPFVEIYKNNQSYVFEFEKLWKELLQNASSESNKIGKKYLVATGINGFLSVAKDPHTYILPIKYFKEVTSNNERSLYFVGLSFYRKTNQIKINKVYKNSDADLAGLKENDEILSVNGHKMIDLSLAELTDLLKDKTIKSYTVSLNRGGQTLLKTIKRSYRLLKQVQTELVESAMGKKFAVIQISKFAQGTCADVKQQIGQLKDNNLRGLVLDLRDNPGGHLTEASCLAGLFIGSGKKIYTTQYFDITQAKEVTVSTEEMIYSGPMVVLVNNASASASEVLAGALQVYKRAFILGQRTFGKGTFQEYENWNSSDSIAFFKTKGFYLLPNQQSPQLLGVKPDVSIVDNKPESHENLNYLNPIRPELYDLKPYTEEPSLAIECLQPKFQIGLANVEDDFIQKSINVLSCQQAFQKLAQQYSSGLVEQTF